MKTFKEFSTFLSEKGQSYIVKDQQRRIQKHVDKGVNPDNPSRMNTNLQFKDTVHQMTPKPIERTIRQFVPYEPAPVKVNKPRSREFGHGRSLKSLIGTAGEA